MKEIKRREINLLNKLCSDEGIPVELANQLLKSAKKFSYENVPATARTKDYQDLIDFHTKTNKS